MSELDRRSHDIQIERLAITLENHIKQNKEQIGALAAAIADKNSQITEIKDYLETIRTYEVVALEVIKIYSNLKGTIVIVNSIQKFFLWMMKWSAFAGIFYFLMSHFGSKKI